MDTQIDNKIRVMLVEDHAGYREAISLALKRTNDIELTSQFGTAEIALRELQGRSIGRQPDIVLLDLSLPGMSGLEAIPWIKQYSPKSNIMILSQSDAESDILKAISLGATGYFLKSATVKQITDGIQTVMSGGASLDPKLAKFIFETLKSQKPQTAPSKSLSNRELEILTLLGDGLIKKEIAERLNISITTVAYHVKHIYEKLDVINAPAAVSQGYKTGILPTEK
ncbi:response regulator transcription factor [Puniceicoccaceae bacterium K14]|nr:response regulator transcription factor [Puniceicoccaceae bacterium K14]